MIDIDKSKLIDKNKEILTKYQIYLFTERHMADNSIDSYILDIIKYLEYVNKDIARRIIDVVSGAAHALDGHMQKISSSIFLVAPYNYDITSETKEETKSKLPVSWLKSNANN